MKQLHLQRKNVAPPRTLLRITLNPADSFAKKAMLRCADQCLANQEEKSSTYHINQEGKTRLSYTYMYIRTYFIQQASWEVQLQNNPVGKSAVLCGQYI